LYSFASKNIFLKEVITFLLHHNKFYNKNYIYKFKIQISKFILLLLIIHCIHIPYINIKIRTNLLEYQTRTFIFYIIHFKVYNK